MIDIEQKRERERERERERDRHTQRDRERERERERKIDREREREGDAGREVATKTDGVLQWHGNPWYHIGYSTGIGAYRTSLSRGSRNAGPTRQLSGSRASKHVP